MKYGKQIRVINKCPLTLKKVVITDEMVTMWSGKITITVTLQPQKLFCMTIKKSGKVVLEESGITSKRVYKHLFNMWRKNI